MYKVVMIPKKKYRPVLILAVETMAEANSLRGVLIEWGSLEHSTLRIVAADEKIEVETYWFWPWRKVVTAHLGWEGND